MNVKICPKCGSTNIDMLEGNIFGIFPAKYKCFDCGFISLQMPEIDSSNIEKFRKKLKNENQRKEKKND